MSSSSSPPPPPAEEARAIGGGGGGGGGGGAFPRKRLKSGKKNPKYIDLCDEDAGIAGQKFACLSFVSPDKILKQRELYCFEAFVKQWEMAKAMEKFNDFLQFLSFKYKLQIDTVLADMHDFVQEEQEKIKEKSLDDDFKTFMEKNEDRLTTEFQKKHKFQTSVRGIKVRGVYGNQDEAEMQCKRLRESDPNHDIYVGPVGVWIPFDPDAYKTGRVEFLEEELNQLHKEKMKNEAQAKESFEKRVRDAKRRAIEENIKLAEKSGNTLTQTIDEDGNLSGVAETVDFESRDVA